MIAQCDVVLVVAKDSGLTLYFSIGTLHLMLIYLATCKVLPEPDPDQDLLIQALVIKGIEARLLPWDDPAAVLSKEAVLCIIRSTWNYHLRRDDFLAWIQAVAAKMPVLNPPSVIEWTTDKSYLRDLSDKGIRIVPTEFIGRIEQISLREMMLERHWRRVVVKPRISAASFGTRVFAMADTDEGDRFLASHLKERPMMVQPYIKSVETHGERSLIWIDGEFTHAIRKNPRYHGADESVSGALPVTDGERRFGEKVIECVPDKLLYARVDVVKDDSGNLMVMELELAEPSLFLLQSPMALTKLVEGIVKNVRKF